MRATYFAGGRPYEIAVGDENRVGAFFRISADLLSRAQGKYLLVQGKDSWKQYHASKSIFQPL